MTTSIVAPISPQQAAANAQGILANLLDEQTALGAQLEADLISVGDGWGTLSSAEQTAVLLRVLNGLGAIMEALVSVVTAAQVVSV